MSTRSIHDSNILNILQRSARNGSLLASCEPEVEELMKQIDVLISDQQKEYLEREQSLKTQLQRQERELSTMRVTVQERNSELEKLKFQASGTTKHQVAFYEAQVSKLRAEVQKISQSYEKLRTKKQQGDWQADVNLKKQLHDLQDKAQRIVELKARIKELEAESDKFKKDAKNLSSQLKHLKIENTSLRDQHSSMEQQLKFCRSHLDERSALNSTLEEDRSAKARYLEAELKHNQELMDSKDATIRSLIRDKDDALARAHSNLAEVETLQDKIASYRENIQKLETRCSELKTQLRRAEEKTKLAELEASSSARKLKSLENSLKNKEDLIKSMEQHNQLLESSTVATMKSEIAQLEERMKREVKQQELHQDDLAKLRARCAFLEDESKSLKSSHSKQLSELKFDHEEAVEKHKRDMIRLKSECGEKLSHIKETTSQEIALLQEELRQQQLIINDKDLALQSLQEQERHLEQQLRENIHTLDKSQSQLVMANAHIATLERENTSLRSTSRISSSSPQLAEVTTTPLHHRSTVSPTSVSMASLQSDTSLPQNAIIDQFMDDVDKMLASPSLCADNELHTQIPSVVSSSSHHRNSLDTDQCLHKIDAILTKYFDQVTDLSKRMLDPNVSTSSS